MPAPAGAATSTVRSTTRARRSSACARWCASSRDALGDEVYRRENTIFRDAGRKLSGTRDAAVLVQTLDDLTARYRDELDDDAFAGLRDALASEAEAASSALADDRAAVNEVQGTLEAARRRVGGWPLPDDGGLAMLEPGFERIYRRGRRALKAARKDPGTEQLPRAAQARQGPLARRAGPAPGGAQGDEGAGPPRPRAVRLTGDDHDLAVLRAAARERHATLAPGELALLERLIARRRRRLQGKALAQGRRLYARKPATLGKLVR